MIRQAISCDICGTDMQHTTHWFVAYDQGDEFRISSWNSRNRLRPGARHLCGQTCLHKLVDEYMARVASARTQLSATDKPTAERPAVEEKKTRSAAPRVDASLTSPAPHRAAFVSETVTSVSVDGYIDEFESSARLIPTPEPKRGARPVAAPVRTEPVESRREPAETRRSVSKPFEARHPDVVDAEAFDAEEARALEAFATGGDEPLDDAPSYGSRNWRAEAWQREREREQRMDKPRTFAARRRSIA